MSRGTRVWLRNLAGASAVALAAACAGGGGSGGGASLPAAPEPLPAVDTTPVALGNTTSALPEHWMHGAFMEIYVRGYQDSDGDGIGDLKGLTQRLDYLKDLGITGIWLMPVTQSLDNNHGYAVSNYRAIEAQYGTLADFDELLRQAHLRGIGVIVDYVVNHSASNHPAFVNSRATAGNPYRDWYVWQTGKPAGWSIFGSDPWRSAASGFYFAPFSADMPDFNLLNPGVVAWHHDNLRFWLNRGVDGFRFDAVGHLVENGPANWNNQPQNYPIMNAVRSLVGGYQHRYLVCEAPGDPKGFAAPGACGAAFAFGQQLDVVRAAKGDSAAIRAAGNYFLDAPATLATMLSNHDAFAGARAWDQFNGNLAQYKLAAATYLLQPGTPFIYYGEEIGMAGGAGLGGDTALRTPMSWTADPLRGGFTTGTPFRALSANVATQNVESQLADGNSIRAFYRSLLTLRQARPSIARGGYDQVEVRGSVLRFRRWLGSEESIVAINYGQAPSTLEMAGLTPGFVARIVFAQHAAPDTITVDVGGNLTLPLPAQSVVVLGR
ncbi:MAG TPA: alpha-amylase family glycosyl hydrolase [Usitatibacteraceae bacterium]|nr:alpha-amylase family glycosyl hydrolase [Usitatibacteraceae bacterium]